MYSFEFSDIIELPNNGAIKNDFMLWIWYANKIPPHIGCSIAGQYFSLKVNGKDNGIKIEKTFELIQKKQIPCFLIKVKTHLGLTDIQNTFESYQHAEPEIATCLTPISQLFNCLNEVQQLSELLKYLQEAKQIEKVFGVNLKEDYRGILSYNQQDITNRLQKLKNVKREKHIS
jgi:hypothetical protein